MEQDFYIKLTLAVYRVTELFPEEELLKLQIRELANKILVDLINDKQSEYIFGEIKILKSYFDLAQAQNLVDSRNFAVLYREYDKIERLINTGEPVENSFPNIKVNKNITKNRKEKILEILKDKKKVQIKELTKDFPQISRRTIIRDMEELHHAGIVVRAGNGRASCYNIKS